MVIQDQRETVMIIILFALSVSIVFIAGTVSAIYEKSLFGALSALFCLICSIIVIYMAVNLNNELIGFAGPVALIFVYVLSEQLYTRIKSGSNDRSTK